MSGKASFLGVFFFGKSNKSYQIDSMTEKLKRNITGPISDVVKLCGRKLVLLEEKYVTAKDISKMIILNIRVWTLESENLVSGILLLQAATIAVTIPLSHSPISAKNLSHCQITSLFYHRRRGSFRCRHILYPCRVSSQ